MNIKNNQRKKESQRKIEEAFVGLLQEKEVNEISVTQICKQAGVNRSTFYANYLDIIDLMDKIEDKMIKDFHELYRDELTQKYNSNDFSKLFIHIKNHQRFYQAYFKMGLDVKFQPERYDTVLAQKYYGSNNIKYHALFFRAGITAIIKLWLNDGCDLDPDELFMIIKDEYSNKH